MNLELTIDNSVKAQKIEADIEIKAETKRIKDIIKSNENQYKKELKELKPFISLLDKYKVEYNLSTFSQYRSQAVLTLYVKYESVAIDTWITGTRYGKKPVVSFKINVNDDNTFTLQLFRPTRRPSEQDQPEIYLKLEDMIKEIYSYIIKNQTGSIYPELKNMVKI